MSNLIINTKENSVDKCVFVGFNIFTCDGLNDNEYLVFHSSSDTAKFLDCYQYFTKFENLDRRESLVKSLKLCGKYYE